MDEERGGGVGGSTASYEWNKVESAQINIRTLAGEYRATLFFFHLLTNVLFHFIQVLLARDDADGSCCMSARNVWQGVHAVGSYKRPGVRHLAHSGQGCHISLAVVRASYQLVWGHLNLV